jgi:drug/metabolite transporter (DMT)-like permease
LAVLGACLAWAVDNNLTRKVSLVDATWIASIKGLVSGSINLVLALALGAHWPSLPSLAGALVLGAFSYGASLALFVVGLRHLGTARTGAYFSVAPFFGAALAIPLLGEPMSTALLISGVLMVWGVWLHLTERHSHEHHHESVEHAHEHEHDEHHQHGHDSSVSPGIRHSHRHRHAPITHTHAHFPDAHHTHTH